MGDDARPAGKSASDGGSLAVQVTAPAVRAASPALHPGARIHQYEIIRLLGEGGMGTVFLARDLRLGRRIAIKLLQADQPEQAQRLLAEARATARCQHDNIVVIHEVGEHGGAPYLVLEYLDGKPLTALLEHGQRLPWARAVEISCAIARALQHAHEMGIVHRDLKPDNIALTEAGAVKVLDFGIATMGEHAGHEPDGEIAGTLQYMSPEQWGAGLPVDHRTDLWACGILLHQMICGQHPLEASQLVTTWRLEQPMPSMAETAPPGVPRELIDVVDRCLRKRKDERWQSAAELLAALAPFLPGRRTLELPVDESPYAGLAAFQESDAAKFFGRSREIAAMMTRLRDRPLLAVAGSSGVGKSSLVRAGLVPALKRSGEAWEALVVRPGRKPLEALATGAHLSSGEPHEQVAETLRREPGHLGDTLRLRARRDGRRILLVVDQLEELYTQVADPAERAAFAACLAAVADDATSPLRVVLAIRADFLDRAAEDPRLADELARGLLFLGPPGREGLRDAIANPAELAGYQLESPILDDMLHHLETAPGALPLLQFAAAELWERRDRERRVLTAQSYAAIGGIAGALASHADRVVTDIGPQRAPLLRALLLRLVTAERTRAIVPLAELRELSPEAGAVQRLIDQLVDARLLVVQTVEGCATVEIVHESLVRGWPALRRWLDENQEDAAFVDQLRTAARQWDARGRDRHLLWRGDTLAEYQLWRRRHPASPTPLEAAFGAASVAETARGRRIRRAIAVGALAVIAVVVAALWRANLAANRAKRESDDLLRSSYLEQGRLRVFEGDKLGALAPLTMAYRMGATDATTRLLLEETVRPTRARLLTLEGHAEKVLDVAYSPNGKWLATASADHMARIWDAATGALHATVQHAGWVTTIAFSPDSRLLASGGQDRIVRVWDIGAGREIAALPVDVLARKVAFSPDGTRLLTASAARVVKLWRIPDGTPAGELGSHGLISGATFCENGSCIVTWDIGAGSTDPTSRSSKIVVWDAATLAQRASYQPQGRIRAAAVSRTGALYAVGTETGELSLLRGDGSLIAKHAAHDQRILDVAISPDETIVATASEDRLVRLWSASGELLSVLASRSMVTQIRFTPAGDRIVTTSTDNIARLWSASGLLLGELTGHSNSIVATAIGPDGGRLATASWDHTAILWDLSRAQELHPLLSVRDPSPPAVTFDPRGDRLAVVRFDGMLTVIDVPTGAVACTAARGATAIRCLTWAGDEEIAIVREGSHSVELWNARHCALESPLEHPARIVAMSTHRGPRLATASGNVVRVWNRGQVEAKFTGYAGDIWRVGIDEDDVYAITESPITLVVDAIADPTQRRIFRAGSQAIADVQFDRERGRILGASFDQFLYIWDAATGTLVHKLKGAGPLWAVRTSPDGTLLIGAGGASPTVWERMSGVQLRQLEGYSELVKDGEFLDDRIFISLAWDHTASIWDVATAQPLMTFHDVDDMAISDDRRSVAFISSSGVRIWSPRMPTPDPDELRRLHPP